MLKDNSPDRTTQVAQILGEEMLLVIQRAEQLVGVTPSQIVAATNAVCVAVHMRFGSGASLPAVLRTEADRLDRMDALDRAAPGRG